MVDGPQRLDAYLEVAADGQWTAHVLALPGCVAFGGSEAEALAGLARDADEYLAWLRRHGGPVPDIAHPPTFTVKETVRDASPARAPGEKVACFGPDRVPVSDVDIEQALRLMRYARADLFALLERLPAGALDSQPSGSEWTPRRIVQHIGQAECWYLTRLDSEDDPAISMLYDRLEYDLAGALAAIQDTAEQRLRAWTPEQRSRVFVPRHYSRYGDEEWTARKVLRRFVEHQREHLAQLLTLTERMAGRPDGREGGT